MLCGCAAARDEEEFTESPAFVMPSVKFSPTTKDSDFILQYWYGLVPLIWPPLDHQKLAV